MPASGRTDADGNTHEAAIDCMIWWEIAAGTSTTQYEPALGVTRAQMASFVARLIEKSGGQLSADAPDAFTDDQGSVHEASVNKLAAAGIVGGKGGGSFAPLEVVSRDQMATFLVAGYEHVSPNTLTASRDYFGDDNGNVHEDNINKAAQAGFTLGRNGGYEPFAPVKRDAMASSLARNLDLLVREDTSEPKA